MGKQRKGLMENMKKMFGAMTREWMCALIIFSQLGIGHYNHITKRFDLYEDGKGKRIGTVEKNRIKSGQYDIRDRWGKRTGTIKWNKIKRVWDIRKQ